MSVHLWPLCPLCCDIDKRKCIKWKWESQSVFTTRISPFHGNGFNHLKRHVLAAWSCSLLGIYFSSTINNKRTTERTWLTSVVITMIDNNLIRVQMAGWSLAFWNSISLNKIQPSRVSYRLHYVHNQHYFYPSADHSTLVSDHFTNNLFSFRFFFKEFMKRMNKNFIWW